jgi:hypothetical protein
MLSDTISFMDFTYCKAKDLEQFRFQNGKQIGSRRIDLKYYVAYQDEQNNSVILIENKISNTTDPKWLKEAIALEAIYLQKFDHDMTLTSIESAQKEVKV